MKEQPLFAPGDRAVCVDSKGTVGLTEGKQETIHAVRRCSCGIVEVNVGVKSVTPYQDCSKCGAVKKSDETIWYMQTRFVPVDFNKYAEETFHQSLKGKSVNA